MVEKFYENFIGIFSLISGIIIVIFSEKFTRNIKIKKGGWTKEQRKKRMLVGGVGLIIIGITKLFGKL